MSFASSCVWNLASVASLDVLTMHEIGESYPQKAEVIDSLGKPNDQMTFVVHKNHKYMRDQHLMCGKRKTDVEVDALYYSADGDSGGYWMFFDKEQML